MPPAAAHSNKSNIFKNKYSNSVKYLVILLCVIIISLFLPKQVRFGYEFEKGQVWQNKDLIAPYDFAILKTPAQVTADRKAILKNILPVYDRRDDVPEASLAVFTEVIHKTLADSNVKDAAAPAHIAQMKALVNNIYTRGLIKAGNDSVVLKNQAINVLHNKVAVRTQAGTLMLYDGALDYLKQNFNTADPHLTDIYLQAAENTLKPNIVPNDKVTDILKQNALNNLSSTQGMVSKGEPIVSKGEVIDEAVYQKLYSYRDTYNSQTNSIGDNSKIWAGQFIIVSLCIGLLMAFLAIFRPDIYQDLRLLVLLQLVIMGMLLVLTVALNNNISSVYFLPYCLVPIIIRMLFDTRLALNLHMLVTLIAAFFVVNSFEFVVYEITAGMVAIYSLKHFVKRARFLLSSLYILSTYFVVFIGITLLHESDLRNIDWAAFLPFVFSVLLCLLAYPMVYAFEKLFGITSDVTLIELTNTNNKLLKELAFKAPGTFQHSLQVANLAEAAVFKIGGNPLLIRAGALYHDIGKIFNPQYFIENQNSKKSPHDDLPYDQSAQIIIQHVVKGIELARKHQLPENLVDFIRTHHGNTRVDYFYQSFLKNKPEEFVDENIFRYPGPTPFSKETGVLMLADSVEAASRSMKEPNAESINKLVERIIDYKLEQNQLDNCDLTLKDINDIKLIFKNMLMSIYHIRIDYPASA